MGKRSESRTTEICNTCNSGVTQEMRNSKIPLRHTETPGECDIMKIKSVLERKVRQM